MEWNCPTACGTLSATGGRRVIGRKVRHYVIEESLGKGGMGEVYRARDSRLSRSVAIKILPPEVVQDPHRRSRFMQEARAASAQAPPLSTVRAGLPSSLQHLIDRCMRKRPEDRFQGMAEVVAGLRGVKKEIDTGVSAFLPEGVEP